jgi:hypothetical protein
MHRTGYAAGPNFSSPSANTFTIIHVISFSYLLPQLTIGQQAIRSVINLNLS